MMGRGRFVFAVCALFVVVSACGTTTSTSSGNQKVFTIGYPAVLLANPNNRAVVEGLQIEAKALGMKVLTTPMVDVTKAVDTQVTGITTLLSEGIDVMCLWPSDPKAIRAALDSARAKGIPIITQDTPQQAAGPVATNVQSDNFGASVDAVKYIASLVPPGAEIAGITGFPFVPVLAQRNDGFAEGVKEAGLNLVAQQVNQTDDANGARAIVDAWKVKYGSALKGIWSYNDPGALGAASAIGGTFQPIVTGMNGDPNGVAAIANGTFAATWDFRPVEIGEVLAWAAYQTLTHHNLPAQINVPMVKYDKSNISQFVPWDERLLHALNISITQQGGQWYLAS